MTGVNRGRVAVLMAFALGCAAVAIPVADAGNEPIASFGLTSGTPALGGTLNNPRGVAVNATGAGGVAPGTVYVTDAGNNRIGRFSPSGDFVGTWGLDVIQSGAGGDTGAGFEICAVAASCKSGVPAPWGGGWFSPRGVAVSQSTGDVYVTDSGNNRVQQFTAGGGFVRAWGAGVVTGGAAGTGTLANSTTTITAVTTTSRAFAVGQAIAGPGLQAGTTITAVSAANGGTITLSKPTTGSAAGAGVALTVAAGAGNVPTNEQQTITLGANTTGGTFTLSFSTPVPSNTSGTTSAIAHGASPATVQTALEALSNIGVGDVAVTGAAGGPWTVSFQGTRFADTDVSPITADAAGLTVSSGTATAAVATTTIGASAPEACTVSAECVAGKNMSGGGQLATTPALTQPAVAPSGNVYIPDAGNARVQEFTPSGAFVRAWGWDVVTPGGSGDSGGVVPSFEICTVATQCKAGVAGSGAGQFAAAHPTAVAVDSAGAVYAADGANARVEKFGSTGQYLSSLVPGGSNQPPLTGYNLAVDRSNDHLLVGSSFAPSMDRRIEEIDAAGALQDTHLASGVTDIGGIGVDPGNETLYVSVAGGDSRVLIVGPVAPPDAAIAPVTSIGARTARLNGTVTPPGGGAHTRYRFEYSTDGVDWTRAPAVDVDVGADPVPVAVHQDVAGLRPNTAYQVRLVASTGPAAGAVDTSSTVGFTTDEAPPLVADTNVFEVSDTAAGLQAKIDPGNLATGYHFEWGETDSYGRRTPSVDATISGGVQTVQRSISGLAPNTIYHFRVVASNAAGPTEGPDRVFSTLNAAGLPNDRGYELVSPADLGPLADAGNGGFQAAADGQSLVWPLRPALEELAARGPGGWSSVRLADGEYRYFADDLSCSVLTSSAALAPGAQPAVVDAGGTNLFRRDADGSHDAVSNLAPTNPAAGGGYRSVDASDDCGHVVFGADYEYPGVGASGLYEWDNGTLRNVGVHPDGSVATGATLGAAGGRDTWNAVSDDGARIFFSAPSNAGADAGKQAVFVREDGASTVKASASQTATANRGANYQLAAEDGSRVLFLANYGLTSSTSAGPTDGSCALAPPLHCDLYEYDVETGQLTDLSAHTAEPGGARVAGVLGASDDASHVYFAARGQLVAGEGRSATANLAAGSFNVYLAHGGQRSFVGLLGAAEVTASSGRNGALVARATEPLSPWASRVTPGGRHLLFPSAADVTGYDSGGVVEAYLYSADADEIVCVSCRRDGQPSTGVPAGGDSSTAPLASDGSTGHGNPLSPPRSLSTDGSRVYFEKPDVLASGAIGGRGNVYQWEDGQIALIAAGSPQGAAERTRFEDASASGDDVFLATRDALVPWDRDGSADVYAVRVGGGLPCVRDCGGIVEQPPLVPRLPDVPARRARFSVERLSRAQRARLAAGKRVALPVRVNRAGRVSVRGVARIGRARKVVLAGTRRAARAGTVRVAVRLSRAGRARLAAVGSLRVLLTVRFSAVRRGVTRTVVLVAPLPQRR
ncbi:MAG TPA: hypothetical protein VEW67_07820 [Thermoleophilaceae bacterium]|nr:hypothetical protein [Thermoleophilaceae bacterium]